jgi:flagellar basal-body rod protein FlgB
MNLIDPVTLALVSRAMDAASLRHAAHAQNIANANVPGAQRVRVSFEDQLAGLQSTIAAHQPVSPEDVPEPSVVPDLGAQNGRIDLDTELAEMSKNSMHYQALARVLSRHMSIMSLAVTDGKR